MSSKYLLLGPCEMNNKWHCFSMVHPLSPISEAMSFGCAWFLGGENICETEHGETKRPSNQGPGLMRNGLGSCMYSWVYLQGGPLLVIHIIDKIMGPLYMAS